MAVIPRGLEKLELEDVYEPWEPRCGVCWERIDFTMPRDVRMVATSAWCIPVHASCYERVLSRHQSVSFAEDEIRELCGIMGPGGGRW